MRTWPTWQCPKPGPRGPANQTAMALPSTTEPGLDTATTLILIVAGLLSVFWPVVLSWLWRLLKLNSLPSLAPGLRLSL
jgi:hypothetical protein